METRWPEIELGTVIKDIAAGPFGSNLKVECFVPYGFPIVDGANLKAVRLTDNISKYVTKEKAHSLKRSIAKRGDIVVTISGTIGQLSFIPKNSKFEEYLCSQRQFRVTFDSSKVDSEYIAYYFHSYEGLHKILAFGNQVGVPALAQPLKNFRLIKVALPPFQIQKKVASILSKLDDKIELNNQINENLEEQAKAIFIEWLQKQRDSVLLRDICDEILDYSKFKQDKVVLINSSDVHKGAFVHNLYSENKNLKGHFKKNFKMGDILYSQIRPRNHHYAYCYFDSSDYIASTRLMIVRNKESKISNWLLYQYLILPNVLENFTLKTESRSGTFPQGNFEDLSSAIVPYGPLESQNEITDIIKDIRLQISRNYEENKRLLELRDALLPKLMSGEIDVSNIEL